MLHVADMPASMTPVDACLCDTTFVSDCAILVGVRGLEPPTSASRTLRASRLRYTPKDDIFSEEASACTNWSPARTLVPHDRQYSI